MSIDPYYSRSEVSNSDLTSLFYRLFPQMDFVKGKDKQQAFRLGTLVDAFVTEPGKIDFIHRTIDEEIYEKEEFNWAKKMLSALKKRARKDKFLQYVLEHAETQKQFVNPSQPFQCGCFKFNLPTRCKFDWWLGHFGGDLKTTAAETQSQFESQIAFVSWDRSRVFYMLLPESLNPLYGQQDFIYAISKKNQKVFFKKILKGDEIYTRGLEKLQNLAFTAWTLM